METKSAPDNIKAPISKTHRTHAVLNVNRWDRKREADGGGNATLGARHQVISAVVKKETEEEDRY